MCEQYIIILNTVKSEMKGTRLFLKGAYMTALQYVFVRGELATRLGELNLCPI